MDDMDADAEELGGMRKFFTGDFARYGWAKLMGAGIGGHELIGLYGEGIAKMPDNPGIPPLFRDIFKNAYLPYRDPETLKSFLKVIDEFSYDHSERLGDAFEYLLSVLGSQGDAGQFRTPRHIIDFMVEVIAPTKSDVVLDPACGTAGFLISAYKHILRANTDLNGNSILTPEEKGRLATHFKGYDISPDMVRLSLVNLYLHDFSDPHIYEYDTLTSDEKWGECYDIIMANPPFMTPKGGIRPHKRFSIQSKKSEALFLDYIIEHLSPSGRAAVVVPDGIVANPSSFNVALRKLAINNGLYCVVSLHSYVFKPYAGAKTSILFFDKRISNSNDDILFIRMDNDGYEKGDQRKKIVDDDTLEILSIIKEFKLKGAASPTSVASSIVKKKSLTGQYSLFVNKYIQNSRGASSHNLLPVGELFHIQKGTLQSTKSVEGEFNFITAAEEWGRHNSYTHDCEALIFAHGASGSLGRTHKVSGEFVASDLCFILTPKNSEKYPVNLDFYHAYFNCLREEIVSKLAKGVSKQSINKTDFALLEIDYVPIDIQEELGGIVKINKEKISVHEKQIQELNEDLNVRLFEVIT